MAAASLPGEKPFELYEDAITEDFGHIFAALVGDQFDALHSVIDDPALNVYVRWQAIEALLVLIRDGVLTRESVVERLTGHLERAIEQKDEVAEGIISRLDDLGAEAALPIIASAFEKQLVDSQMIGSLEHVQRNIVRGDEAFQETIDRLRRPQDLIAHLSKWAAFQEEDEDESDTFVSDPLLLSDEYLDDADYVAENETTIRNEGVKIGRNEKCPCGSGKKYKKCCGKM